MIVECISIILVILCTAFIFVRRKKKLYAIAVIPLTLVPLIHFVMFYILSSIDIQKINFGRILSAADIAALVLSCILIGLFAGNFKSKAARNTYMIISALFSIILASIFIADTISKIMAIA